MPSRPYAQAFEELDCVVRALPGLVVERPFASEKRAGEKPRESSNMNPLKPAAEAKAMAS
jgi:hypothetical protein